MSYNTPVRHLQGGSVLEVAPSGTALISSGGSIQVASGASLNVAIGATFNAPGGITSGGTLGRFAFGTVGFASGVGTFATGLNRVVSASIQPISADPPGLGSFVTSVIDLTLSGAGSIIFRAGAGTLPYAAGGTVAWLAWGT